MFIQSKEFKELSKSEKKQLASHLLYALGSVFILGLITLMIGLSYYKSFITLTGLFLLGSVSLIFLVLSIRAHIKHVNQFKAPYLKQLDLLIKEWEKALELLQDMEKEFPKLLETKSRATSNQWSKAGLVHYFSLTRITESLGERLKEVDTCLDSISERSIYKGIKLLESPLILETKYDEHLIDHDIPEMPPSTWIDSLKFLCEKVSEESKRRTKKNPLHTV